MFAIKVVKSDFRSRGRC